MIVISLLAAALSASSAPVDPVIVNPGWHTPPSPGLLEEPMPPFASLIGVDARVVVRCQTPPMVAAPEDCTVVSTTVTGMGFEDKAIETAATGLIAPRTVDGVPTLSWIQFAVTFHAEDWAKPTPNPYQGAAPSQEGLALARQVIGLIGEPLAEAMKQGQAGYDFPELEPVRRARVREWMTALFPLDPARVTEAMVVVMARLMTVSELKTLATTGVPPDRVPTEDEVINATSDLEDFNPQKIDTLKARYCAAYDCGPPADRTPR